MVKALDNQLEEGIRLATNPDEPIDQRKELAVWLKGPNDTLYGGLWGWTYFGWLYVDALWVHEGLRGTDFGTQLITIAETEAKKRGCHSARLETLSFQARPFYEKLGYQLFGEIPNHPAPHTMYFLSKRLE